jgi:hypothetical protein
MRQAQEPLPNITESRLECVLTNYCGLLRLEASPSEEWGGGLS